MDITNLPLIWYALILAGLLAVIILIRGFRMPSNHSANEHVRSVIRKKLYMLQDNSIPEDSDKKNQVS